MQACCKIKFLLQKLFIYNRNSMESGSIYWMLKTLLIKFQQILHVYPRVAFREHNSSPTDFNYRAFVSKKHFKNILYFVSDRDRLQVPYLFYFYFISYSRLLSRFYLELFNLASMQTELIIVMKCCCSCCYRFYSRFHTYRRFTFYSIIYFYKLLY